MATQIVKCPLTLSCRGVVSQKSFLGTYDPTEEFHGDRN